MNATFKVVFNKARGALMVVNEITSCVQCKGTKTVVATAVAAMIAGTAMAANPVAIGDTTYETFKAALDASKAGDTIVFKEDLLNQAGLGFGKLFKNPISERWGKQICLN